MLGVLVVIVCIVAVAFLCGLGRASYLRDQMHRVMARLAYKRGGDSSDDGMSIALPGPEPGTVVEAHLHEFGQLYWRTYMVELVLDDWADEELQLTLSRRGWSWLFRGWGRLRTKDRGFDRRFAVYGEPPEAVLQQLAPSVRSRMEMLADGWPRGIQLSISCGSWRLFLDRAHKNRLELLKAIDIVYGIVDEAQSVLGHGIEIVPCLDEASAEAAICKVCGEALEIDIIYCSSCQTPHHKDCWRYIGQCSVFACGGKRTVRKLTPTNA